jgi:L,D-transpeptidase YbiS
MRDRYAGVIDGVLGQSKNRKAEGELGNYRLNLGDGYFPHGTPYKESIAMAAAHGCVRLRDERIEWLYDHVPVGTRVYIHSAY